MNSVTVGRFAFICLAFIVLKASGEATKCVPEIIENIKTFWGSTGGPPKNILKDLEALGRGALYATTINDHITSKNLTEPECVYADITTTSAVFSVVTNKNTIETNKVSLIEKSGVVSIPEDKRDIYFILQDKGVSCYYSCSESGPEGPPDGAVAVAMTKYEEPQTLKLADLAVDLLSGFSIDVDYLFGDVCFV